MPACCTGGLLHHHLADRAAAAVDSTVCQPLTVTPLSRPPSLFSASRMLAATILAGSEKAGWPTECALHSPSQSVQMMMWRSLHLAGTPSHPHQQGSSHLQQQQQRTCSHARRAVTTVVVVCLQLRLSGAAPHPPPH
jgi:hypothetical protein